jgi:NAD(P)H-hydrate epimerase
VKIYGTQDIKTIDSLYMQACGVTEQELIERAAAAFVKSFLAKEPEKGKILVLAGPGNNGSDARSIAGLLQGNGYEVVLWEFPGAFAPTQWQEDWTRCLSDLPAGSIVVDGLFGSGLSRPLEGLYTFVVESVNALKFKVYAVDIPSGLPGDGQFTESKAVCPPVVRADVTLAFQFPKLAFFLPENYPYVGDWEVLDIGMGCMDYPGISVPFVTTDAARVQSGLPPKRHPFSHKYNHGHALLLAASRGKMGAALMAARACMRTGAGMLTAHVPACGEVPFYTALPEAMLSVDSRAHAAGDLPGGLEKTPVTYAAIGAGPGWGKDPVTSRLFERLLTFLKEKSPRMPLVLDADAINMLSEFSYLPEVLPKGTVLTPHAGEFDRLVSALGWEKAPCSHDRIFQAIALAKKWNVVVVLKGRYTLITNGDEPHLLNTTGNPGMATAGSGDVLTGIILGLLAQGIPAYHAAAAGVFLHGQAGDRAAGMSAHITATDIIRCL